ncbi:MAG: diguanylate cyclase [Rhodospirillales bacterium]|nr:diguanylate cyclase [Rhodospirillales bacterium]
MIRFLGLRAVEILVVLVIMSFVIYALIGLMPGDPIDLMITANPKLTAADIVRLKAVYGIDQPLMGRYLAWLRNILQGDLGFSRLYSQPSVTILLPRLGNSALLMGTSFVLALAIGLPAGIAAARRPHSLLDHAINFACFAGISVPSFWLALMLILVFAVALGWLPAGGLATIGDGGFVDRIQHLVLPVATLTLASIGGYTRFMRSAMAEALRQDFIRTARAKGAGERRVVLHHALRNAMIPVVTIVALSFGTLFSGALITETMFAYPGMGKLIFDSVMGNDYNLALAGLLFATLVTLLANLAADVAYAWLDPRITYR